MISVMKLVLWTSIEMPMAISSNTEYSLFANSYIVTKIRGNGTGASKIDVEETKENSVEEVYTIKDVLKNLNFYIIFIAQAGMTMRRSSYLGWLGKTKLF